MWDKNLKQLVKRVGEKMGCNHKKIKAKLNKMLVYKAGGHFKKHREAEKDENMFATLVLQLPSVFTGGRFIGKFDFKYLG